MSEISVNYSFAQSATSTDAPPTWSFNGARIYPGPSGTAILHRIRNDARMLAQPELIQALQHCRTFRPLERHAQTVMEAMPPLRESPEDVINTLSAVRDAGLLESSTEAWQRLTGSIGPASTPACRIFILTCDRPEALKRLLSHLSSQSLPQDIEGLWVIDDSRRPSSIDANRDIIDAYNGSFSIPLHHFDAVARDQFVKNLRETLPDHDRAIQFLLDRDYWPAIATYGLARNFTLLLSVGKRALVFDDDVIPEAVAPPLSGTELTIGTANNREALLYSESSELDRFAMTLPKTPAALMMTHLGENAGKVASSLLKGHQALSGWNGELLASLNSESRILLTQCGSWGDPGTGSGNWIFFLKEPSIKRLLQTHGDIESALSARAAWFGYRGPVLSQAGVMSQLTGLSNDTLLPPYCPVGRGEDNLFGIMLRRLHPHSAVFNEGWAVKHQPLEQRIDRGELSPLKTSLSLATLADWLGREPPDQWGLNPERQILGLADALFRLSEMETEALASLAAQELLSKNLARLSHCFEHLEEARSMEELAGYPSWVRFLNETKEQATQAIQSPESGTLFPEEDLPNGLDGLRQWGADFACALESWNEIREAARDFSAA